MAKAAPGQKAAPKPVTKNIPASDPAVGIDFGDDVAEDSPAEASGLVLDKGPLLVAMNKLVGLLGKGHVTRKGQRFHCDDKAERARLLSLGAARIASEVDAERNEAEQSRIIE